MKKILFVLLVAAVPVFASAHYGIASLEKTVGEYFFDIGYSAEFIAGDLIRFDLAVLDETTREILPFSNVWVRIKEGDRLLFAGPIDYGEFGRPGFSFVFPREGEYTLSTRFETPSQQIPEQDFSIAVVRSPEESRYAEWLIRIAALAAGAGVGIASVLIFKKHA
ncbi:MAG TPA: hypothetical protein VGE35_00450 [Candidatus Paceibacterota bacterium]